MAIVSSGPISIWACVQEFPQAGYNMSSLEQVILGRGSGNIVSMSEFYGRANLVNYSIGIGGADWSCYDSPVTFNTIHGPVWLRIVNAATGGNNHINIIHSYGGGYEASWNKFKQVLLTDSNAYGPGSFSYNSVFNGSYHFFRGGYIPGGTLVFTYYG